MLNGIRARLLVTFLVASVLPLTLGGWVFYALVNQTITSETFQKVGFARNAKSSEISQYLTHARKQAEDLALSSNVRYSVGDFYGFSYAIRQLPGGERAGGALLRDIFEVGRAGGQPDGIGAGDRLLREALEYANVYRRFHAGFLSFLADSPFDNLYLVDRYGQVVYASAPDAYLGRFLDGSAAGLERAHDALSREAGIEPIIQDFSLDAVTETFAGYVAVPVRLHSRKRGALILRMPTSGIQTLLARSETPLTVLSEGGAVIASSDAAIRDQFGRALPLPAELTNPAAVAILEAGLMGSPTLSAWGQLHHPDPPWLVVAEASMEDAFFNSRRLSTALTIIGASTLAALSLLLFFFSKSLTRPIRRLAEAASAVADGNLNENLPEYDSPVEYAQLSSAVSSMRKGLRDQLDLIRDKNDALQQNLRQIEEKNAKLEEADRIKDRFLANTSHELRTPLNGIIGILETLEAGAMGEMKPGQKSQLRLITSSARRLSRLVDDLLDIYRIREGRMRLDLQPVNVGHSLRNVAQLVEPMMASGSLEKPLEVILDLPEDLPAVWADPVRYEQILFNLISNAAKYGGGGDITIAARQDGDDIVVAVTDQGPGIAAESIDLIFHPLEQLTPGTQGPKSTGLGLTIARNLAVLMEGRIEVTSKLGHGSTFEVHLPVSDAPAPQAPDEFAPQTLPTPQHTPLPARAEQSGLVEDAPVILTVDDEPINLQVLQNVLLPQGYQVIKSAGGAEALRSVATAKPDLIVLDVMMPGINGLEVTQQLRRRYGLHELPIILLTARGRSSDMIAGFEAGANDYVVKPFVKDELLSRIRTLLQASRAHRSSEENLELREEIERRVQIEDALRLSQRRMTQLLDTLDDGLICVNARDVVTYVNAQAEQLLDRSIQVNQSLLSDLLPPQAHLQLSAVEADDDPEQISLSLGDQTIGASVFAMMPEAGGGKAILLSPAGKRPGAFVHSLRDVVDSSLPSLIAPAGAEATPAPSNDAYRQCIVDLMSGTLTLWSDLTGKGKIEFAETSGIWRVNLDKTSLQTRTLDKYLLVDTLPANPRWRDVVKSVNFIRDVAAEAQLTDEMIARAKALETQLAQFREMVAQRG
ncbi:Autoinducer 2 sensor kinase/phosphatase LuxQ [Thalassovita autumnalis]|uniref:histidine kinase n=1 Tax=Thalassovita autumnalis TaxID=2072972 RepID=A0A0P1FWC5_9RHOB|nr:hybrid sensor histidine kinase/response regulator [Thalassovita autumnalis]CUH70143.1 Autoinducer 2 sensor kinase/phosphatase LuxQ [Thalassovita autumnalis]CUH73222.1 Autoinducer 2 sensor kinase/phosphatase LuxQ [Thalassovita autumnalis]